MKYTNICIYFQRNIITKTGENNVCLVSFQHLDIFRKYIGHQYFLATYTMFACTCGKHTQKLSLVITKHKASKLKALQMPKRPTGRLLASHQDEQSWARESPSLVVLEGSSRAEYEKANQTRT